MKSLVALFASLVLIAGCGGEEPAGPDVTGMTLDVAEQTLDAAGVTYSSHAKDALFGIVVKQNFVVCEVKHVNDRMVRLEVAKRGC